jgi:nucleotide-binding universal stress UspA family protein
MQRYAGLLMAARHVLLCYLGSADSDEVLREAAKLCSDSSAELSVLLPFVDAPVPDGCCGIQGEHWRRLMDEQTRDAADRAERLLTAWGCPPVNVAIQTGTSIRDIALRAATRYGCDVVAVGRRRRRWSFGGLPRRELKELHRAAPERVLELPATGRSALA